MCFAENGVVAAAFLRSRVDDDVSFSSRSKLDNIIIMFLRKCDLYVVACVCETS